MKTRETSIVTEVIGYREHAWRRDFGVQVRISGMGPNGKLSGIVSVYERDVDFSGDGRYSFMHGNSSLYGNKPFAIEIEQKARAAASEWRAANPNGLHEHKLRCAQANVERWQASIRQLESQLDATRLALKKAEQDLAELQGQQ